MKDLKKYATRYFVEDWNKEVPQDSGQIMVMPGVIKSADDFGYTDQLVIVSILKHEDGSIESMLALDSESGGPLSKSLTQELLDYLQHYLKEHAH